MLDVTKKKTGKQKTENRKQKTKNRKRAKNEKLNQKPNEKPNEKPNTDTTHIHIVTPISKNLKCTTSKKQKTTSAHFLAQAGSC